LRPARLSLPLPVAGELDCVLG